MATILCISSQTARGYVGGSAARIALEALDHQLWLLPAVILSNHPGHATFAGEQVPTGRLQAMLDALAENGWLDEVDAVLTGYLPTPEHVRFAARAVDAAAAANPSLVHLCDPILGDEPDGLYIDETAASALRAELAPKATILTPNRFELEWLSGVPITSVADALAAAKGLTSSSCLATSLPGTARNGFCNLLIGPDGAWQTEVPVRPMAPHGTGDLLAALYLGHRLNGACDDAALALATGGVEAALDASGLSDELQLAASRKKWAGAKRWPVTALDMTH